MCTSSSVVFWYTGLSKLMLLMLLSRQFFQTRKAPRQRRVSSPGQSGGRHRHGQGQPASLPALDLSTLPAFSLCLVFYFDLFTLFLRSGFVPCPGWTPGCNPPASAFQSTGQTGLYHLPWGFLFVCLWYKGLVSWPSHVVSLFKILRYGLAKQ